MARAKNLLLLTAVLAVGLWMSAGSAAAQAITRAYDADSPLQRGMIVRINSKDTEKVEALTASSDEKMEGVVVAANDSPVTLSSEDQSRQQVFVATSGRYYVLVSTQNGPIKPNDHIAISSLAGIGMRAGDSNGLVVGKALEGFDGTGNISGSSSIKDSTGQSKEVAIGLVAADISITRNPGRSDSKGALHLPGFKYLQAGAHTVTGKPVDMSRVYLACLVLLLSVAVAASILYAGVKTSMMAIGRNPLAKNLVIKNLIQVIAISIFILLLGVIAVYLILKL